MFLYQTINMVFNGGMLGGPWGLPCLWQVLNIVASYFKNTAVLFFFQTVMYNMCCKQHSWIFCDSNI